MGLPPELKISLCVAKVCLQEKYQKIFQIFLKYFQGRRFFFPKTETLIRPRFLRVFSISFRGRNLPDTPGFPKRKSRKMGDFSLHLHLFLHRFNMNKNPKIIIFFEKIGVAPLNFLKSFVKMKNEEWNTRVLYPTHFEFSLHRRYSIEKRLSQSPPNAKF